MASSFSSGSFFSSSLSASFSFSSFSLSSWLPRCSCWCCCCCWPCCDRKEPNTFTIHANVKTAFKGKKKSRSLGTLSRISNYLRQYYISTTSTTCSTDLRRLLHLYKAQVYNPRDSGWFLLGGHVWLRTYFVFCVSFASVVNSTPNITLQKRECPPTELLPIYSVKGRVM